MSQAVLGATQGLQLPRDAVDTLYSDINGERYRSEEWGFVAMETYSRVEIARIRSAGLAAGATSGRPRPPSPQRSLCNRIDAAMRAAPALSSWQDPTAVCAARCCCRIVNGQSDGRSWVMSSVSVNPPKTPVTKGSNGIATATIPNVCKMPGPPAPFVPAPLPNIGKSGKSPQDYTKDVTIEGNAVAIKGSTFESMGDIASKGTGGGMVSANCEGITKFVGPARWTPSSRAENVQFLERSDAEQLRSGRQSAERGNAAGRVAGERTC